MLRTRQFHKPYILAHWNACYNSVNVCEINWPPHHLQFPFKSRLYCIKKKSNLFQLQVCIIFIKYIPLCPWWPILNHNQIVNSVGDNSVNVNFNSLKKLYIWHLYKSVDLVDSFKACTIKFTSSCKISGSHMDINSSIVASVPVNKLHVLLSWGCTLLVEFNFYLTILSSLCTYSQDFTAHSKSILC